MPADVNGMPGRDLSVHPVGHSGLRKKFIIALFAVYFLTLLTAVWWPINFHLPADSKPYFETFDPMKLRSRWRLEKDVLKLAMFIPIGVLLVVLADPRSPKWKIISRAVLVGTGLSLLMQSGRYFLSDGTAGLADIVMNGAGAFLGAAVICFAHLSRRLLGWLTLACVLCFIVTATWPCRFTWAAATWETLSARVEWSPWGSGLSLGILRERALNGLMMMPLGLLAATYALRSGPVRRALIFATLLGLGGSVCVELLQCFLPYRTPSLSDVSLNTLGTLAGGVVAVYLDRWGTTRSSPGIKK